jgi:hypothetical protein
MAAFQGARLRAVAIPDQGIAARARGVSRPVASAIPRPRPAGLLLAAILAATMIALVYLTQTLASNATSSEIADLADRREEIARLLRNQALAIETWADPAEVGRKARELGLRQLGDVVVLPAD